MSGMVEDDSVGLTGTVALRSQGGVSTLWGWGVFSTEQPHQLQESGWYEFTVPRSSIGVVCGLNDVDNGTSPTEIDHGFYFTSGKYAVIEGGNVRTNATSYAEGTKFSVVRSGKYGKVYYCVGDVPTFVKGEPFLLPGEVVYTSFVFSQGLVFLDASLFVAGDEVRDAKMVVASGCDADPVLKNQSVIDELEFEPMTVVASNSGFAHANVEFEPMRVLSQGFKLVQSGATLSMLPPVVIASDVAVHSAHLAFEPMTVVSEVNALIPTYALATLVMEPAMLFSSGAIHVDQGSDIAFEPMVVVSASGDYTTSDHEVLGSANLSFEEPTVFATGFFTSNGALMNVMLPAVVGFHGITSVLETARFYDLAHPFVRNDYRETAVLNDRVSITVRVARDLRETARLDDTTSGTARTPVDVTETAVIVDATTLYNYRTDVRETAGITDSTDTAGVGGAVVRETAKLFDRAVNRIGVDVTETAVITDTASASGIERADLRETAPITDTITTIVLGVETVRDSATLNDVVVPRVLALEIVVERAFISDEVESRFTPVGSTVPVTGDKNSSDAWTANILTWGMSRYTGFPLNDFDDTYALSDVGVFTHGDVADATFTTGASHLKAPVLKAVSALYAYGTHDEPLEIDVTADVRGERQTNSYTQMARPNESARTVRTDIGRGYYSNTYQLTVRGTGNFVVNSFEPVVGAGTRRI